MNTQNLKPIRSKDEARKRGRTGGIKSGQVRREKKLMSEIYAAYLAGDHLIDIDGKMEKLSGQPFFDAVMDKILSRGDSASVSMMREVREATEGSKLLIDPIKIKVVFGNDDNDPADIPANDIPVNNY